MAPSEVTDDCYAALGVSHTATFDDIKQNYRRLTRILHPDKNSNKPEATASFQRLLSAYETVSDPERRQTYDSKWRQSKSRQTAQKQAGKSQAENMETDWKWKAEETLRRQREQKAWQERLQPLEKLQSSYERDIFEMNRTIRRLSTELKRLQEQDDEEDRLKRESNSWWTYLTPFSDSRVTKTKEEQQQIESERLQRRASKRIKEHEMQQRHTNLECLEIQSKTLKSKIAAEKRENEEASWARAKEQEEAKRRAEEQQERKRRAEFQAAQDKLRREEAERKAKAREAREVREEQERVRLAEEAAAAARAKKEAQERIRLARESEAAKGDFGSRPTTKSKASSQASSRVGKSICRHNTFWPQLNGRQLCEHCGRIQRHFVFECPGCSTRACANCRRSLKSKLGRNGPVFDEGPTDYYDDDWL